MNTMTKSIRSIVDQRLSSLTINNAFQKEIIDTQPPARKGYRKLIAVAIAAVLCLTMSIAAMGAFIPGFNYLLSQISPDVAKFLNPVEFAHIDNGIRIELVGVMRDADTVIAYLTMQDLTEDRLGRNATIDKYSIPGGFISGQQVVSYDEQTKTATLRLVIEDFGELEDEEVAIQIDALDTWKERFRWFDIDVNLTGISSHVQTTSFVPMNMAGGNDPFIPGYSDINLGQDSIKILKPDETHIPIKGADNPYISNIGIVDGYLHVQTYDRRMPPWENQNEGFINIVALTNAPIDEIDAGFLFIFYNDDRYYFPGKVSYNFLVDENNNLIPDSTMYDENGVGWYYTNHTEYIFDKLFTEDELSAYRLLGSGLGDDIIEGDWQASFKIEPEKIAIAQCDISIEDVHIDSFNVSPFRMYISGTGVVRNEAPIEILISMKDGEVKKFGATLIRNEQGNLDLTLIIPTYTLEGEEINQEYSRIYSGTMDTTVDGNDMADIRIMPELPIDIDNIAQITLNGHVINFD
jgi:hypothetical protein